MPGVDDSAPTVQVLVVEDHDAMRRTLADAVDRLDGFETVGTAATADEALELLQRIGPQIAIVDLSLGGTPGTHLISQIARRWPSMACLVLSGHREPHYVRAAIEAGARGYVLKGSPPDIEHGLRAVAGGATYRSPSLT